jgi:hypothetical protein
MFHFAFWPGDWRVDLNVLTWEADNWLVGLILDLDEGWGDFSIGIGPLRLLGLSWEL